MKLAAPALLFAMGTLACSSSSDSLSCGPGTTESNGQCVAADSGSNALDSTPSDDADSSASDAPPTTDAPSSDTETAPDACSIVTLSCTSECGGTPSACDAWKCADKPQVVSSLPFGAYLPDHPTGLACIDSPACGTTGSHYGIELKLNLSPFPADGVILTTSTGWGAYAIDGTNCIPTKTFTCLNVSAPGNWFVFFLANDAASPAGGLEIRAAKPGEICP